VLTRARRRGGWPVVDHFGPVFQVPVANVDNQPVQPVPEFRIFPARSVGIKHDQSVVAIRIIHRDRDAWPGIEHRRKFVLFTALYGSGGIFHEHFFVFRAPRFVNVLKLDFRRSPVGVPPRANMFGVEISELPFEVETVGVMKRFVGDR